MRVLRLAMALALVTGCTPRGERPLPERAAARDGTAAPSASVDAPVTESSSRATAPPPPATTATTAAADGAGDPHEHDADAPKISFVTRRTKGAYDGYLAYPELTFASPAISKAVNARIRGFVTKRERAFGHAVAEEGRPDADGVGPRAFLALTCDVAYASHALVSVGCDGYDFRGGAHGSKSYTAINLELPSMRDVRLSDFVRTGRSAHAKLAELCNAAVADTAGDGVLDATLRFDTFTIERDGLSFFFKDQLPHVIADAATPHLTWKALAPIRRPGAPEGLVHPSALSVSADAPLTTIAARNEEDEAAVR